MALHNGTVELIFELEDLVQVHIFENYDGVENQIPNLANTDRTHYTTILNQNKPPSEILRTYKKTAPFKGLKTSEEKIIENPIYHVLSFTADQPEKVKNAANARETSIKEGLQKGHLVLDSTPTRNILGAVLSCRYWNPI